MFVNEHNDSGDEGFDELELRITNGEVEDDGIFGLVIIEIELDEKDEVLFVKSKAIFEEKIIFNYKDKYFD